MSAETKERTSLRYGNWRKPRTAGLGPFGLVATVVAFVGLGAVVVTALLAGPFAGLITVGVVLLILVPLLWERDGRNLAQRMARRASFWRARRSGAAVYRSGPLSRTDFGRFRLPGLLAGSRLHEHRDSFGAPFALLEIPATGHFSLVLRSSPPNSSGEDEWQVDQWVANWGGFLAAMAFEPDVVAVSATIESSQDTGARIRSEISRHRRAGSPALARAVVDELHGRAIGGPQVTSWVTITFTRHGAGGLRRTPDEMAIDLASRVPFFRESLSITGAGPVAAATAAQLCEQVRVAYDPAAAAVFAEAEARGESVDLAWSDVGPSAAQASWDRYRHDSGTSITWEMVRPPRGHVLSGVLTRLLEATPGVERKRVSLLYRVMSAEVAGTTADADAHQARNRANGVRPSASARQEAASAARTAEEEAKGAGLVDFGMLVTATVVDQDLAWVSNAIAASASASRVRLRPAYGAQDSAFAAALPVGLVLEEHVSVPVWLKELAR